MADDISPRKQMAMGKKDSGAGGVGAFPSSNRPAHPDAGMGSRGELGDTSRGIGAPVAHTPGQLPAQAAPDHGPHYERQNGYNRGAKA